MYAFASAITMGNASSSLADLERAIDAGETDIGLAALGHSDSSAVAVLLAGTRRAEASGKALRVRGMPASLPSLAQLDGGEDLLRGTP